MVALFSMDKEAPESTSSAPASSTRRSSERLQPPGAPQDGFFTFVNFEPVTSSVDAKRQVRSAATRWQHDNGPPKRRRQPRSAAPLHLLAPATGPDVERELAVIGRGNEVANVGSKSTAPMRREQLQDTSFNRAESEGFRSCSEHTKSEDERLEACIEQMLNALTGLATSPLKRSFSRGTAAARVFLLNDATNSTGRALRQLRTDLVTVLRVYEGLAQFQGQSFVKEVKNQLKPDAPPVNVVHLYLGYIASDPAAVLAAVLLSVHLLRKSPNWVPQPHEDHCLLVLRQAVIVEINSALDDPLRRISSPIMIAVALLSAYEAHYGSIQGWHIHVAGLVRMIQMRGGLAEIGRHSIYEELWFLWQIRNTSSIAKCEDYWIAVSRTSALQHPRANLEVFYAEDLKGKQTGQA